MDFSNTVIKKITTHIVGNKLNEDGLKLTNELTQINDGTNEYVMNYFLNPFKTEDYQSFSNKVDLNLNTIYNLTQKIFSNNNDVDFVNYSQNVAKHLYEQAMHPKIKMGELHVVYMLNCRIKNKTCDAIGIFKTETKDVFLKILASEQHLEIGHDSGISLTKLDKGCIIFNTEAKSGYQVLVFDNNGKGEEAQYWKNNFLSLTPCADEFHFTNNYLKITKDFVTKQISEEFEVSKTDAIDMLNKSVGYFKVSENFNEREFTNEVFNNPEVIESFKKYKNNYTQELDISLDDDFQISVSAVKKQARIFKSVLKLDKNFHVYIHGNKDLIENGIEPDGRKFYKIYYTEET